MAGALVTRPIRNRGVTLEPATVREFQGGWNVIDNDLNLTTEYSVELTNMSYQKDGSMGVRQGTEYLINLGDLQITDPEVVQIPQGSGSNIGDMTDGGGLAAAFDSVTSQTSAASAQGSIDLTATVGKNYGAGANIAPVGVVIYPTSNDGFCVGTRANTQDIFFEGSDNGVDWTILGDALAIDGNNPSGNPIQITVDDVAAAGTFDYLRVRMEIIAGHIQATTCCVAEVEFFEVTGDPEHVGGHVIHLEYFDTWFIIFMSTGKIFRARSTADIELIWSDGIAALLPGAPTGWSADLTFVSAAPFGTDLIVCNGVDKPLSIQMRTTPYVTYLQDLGTGSNANTPIGRYVYGINNYVVIAGNPLEPSTIHISSLGTSGTFVGDPDPNDAVDVDIGKLHPTDPNTITGLSEFRDKLMVWFETQVVPVQLGIYDSGGNHTPAHDDEIPGHGSVAHHSIKKVSNDTFSLDFVGVPSIVRGLFTETIEPKRVSELIDPAIQRNLSRLKTSTIQDQAKAVNHKLESQYILAIPDQDERQVTLDDDPLSIPWLGSPKLRVRAKDHLMDVGNYVTLSGATGFNVYSADDLNRQHEVCTIIDPDHYCIDMQDSLEEAWTTPNSDPNDQVGGGGSTVSTANFGETYAYVYTFLKEGTRKVKAWSLFRGLRIDAIAVTALGRVVVATGSHLLVLGDRSNPVYKDYVGSEFERPIEWAWELPWADFDTRLNTKVSRYISHDTVGDDHFLCQMFANEVYTDAYGELMPVLAMQFVAGQQKGYGAGSQSYGAGRSTKGPRLYGWPSRFKVAKLRYSGNATKELKFISISMLYQRGSIRLT